MLFDRDCRAPYERALCEKRVCQCGSGRPSALLLSLEDASKLKKTDDLDLCGSARGLRADGGIEAGASPSLQSVSPEQIVASSSSSSSSSRNAGTPAGKNLIDDSKFVMCFRDKPMRVGEQWLLCGRRRSRFPFHLMVGPDWPMVVLVYALIISINSIVLGVASPCLGWPVLLIGLSGFGLLLLAYTSVACSDPGIIYQDLEDAVDSDIEIAKNEAGGASINDGGSPPGSDNGSTTPILDHALSGNALSSSANSSSSSSSSNINSRAKTEIIHGVPCKTTMECGQCQIQRPFSARHCNYCGVCIEEIDHHCPWCVKLPPSVSAPPFGITLSSQHSFLPSPPNNCRCGKCIGAANMPAFSAFLGMLCFQGYLIVGIFIYYIVTCFFVSDAPKGPGFN